MSKQNRLPEKPKITRKRTAHKGARQAISLGQVSIKKTSVGGSGHPTLFAFTLFILYKNLYILGITLIRRCLRFKRKIRSKFRRLRAFGTVAFEHLTFWLQRFIGEVYRRLRIPLDRIQKTRQLMEPAILEKRAQGITPYAEWWEIAQSVLLLIWTVIYTAFNHVAPVLALLFLISAIQGQIHVPMGLEVEYNGEIVGYIRNESEFDAAAEVLRDRFISTDAEQVIIAIPRYNLVRVESDDLYIEVEDLADNMVRTTGSDIREGYGLYVDSQFYGAVQDRDYIPAEMEKIRQSHSMGLPNEVTRFVKSIRFSKGVYPLSSFTTNEALRSVLYRYETVDEIYTAQEGDSPSGIASKLGVPYALLTELNPDIESSLFVGQKVLIAKARPFLSVKNVYTTQYEEEYDFEVEEIPTDQYAIGYREIAQDGEKGIQLVTAEISAVDGMEIERKILETKIAKEPVSQKVIVGTNNPRVYTPPPGYGTGGQSVQSAPGGFIWPTQGGIITVGLNGYYGHTGVDIPRPPGTPIYAAASGRVVIVKYAYTAYGYHVYVDHGDGFVTLYAHTSAIHVQVGDYVEQGQQIASVGRTGRATGNHLHFEIRYNGRIMNPRNYIGG